MKKKMFALLPIMLMALGFAACGDDDPVTPEPPRQEENEQPGDKPGEDPGDQPGDKPEDKPGEEPNGGVSQSAVSSIIRTDKGEQLLLTGLAGVLEEGGESIWTMAYDDQGRITLASVTEEEETEAFQLSYEPFKIEFPEEYRYLDNCHRERIVVLSGTLNEKGYLASLRREDYFADRMDVYLDYNTYLSYDDEGHLIKARNVYDEQHNWDGLGDAGTWTFTWKDGLLTEANFVAQGDFSTVEERYEIAYNKNDKNKYNQYTVGLSEITGTGPLALAGLLGKGPDQFIGWYNYIYEEYEGDYLLTEGDTSLGYGYGYEVNEDGTLAKETSYIMAVGGPAPIVAEYTYTYSPFGSSTAKKAPAAPAWSKKATKQKVRLPFQPRGMAR